MLQFIIFLSLHELCETQQSSFSLFYVLYFFWNPRIFYFSWSFSRHFRRWSHVGVCVCGWVGSWLHGVRWRRGFGTCKFIKYIVELGDQRGALDFVIFFHLLHFKMKRKKELRSSSSNLMMRRGEEEEWESALNSPCGEGLFSFDSEYRLALNVSLRKRSYHDSILNFQWWWSDKR